MARYYVAYTKSIGYKYKANLRSNVTVFLVLNAFFCFFLPIILCYNSNGFWIKEHYFKEQPIMMFKYEYLIILETKVNNNPASSIICTTYQEIDLRHTFSENCSFIKIVEKDENNDGKNDYLHILLGITDVTRNDITGIHLFLIFDYKIYKECVLEMEVMAMASQTFSWPIGKMNLLTELNTNFKYPINCNTRLTNHNYSSIIPTINTKNDRFNAIQDIVTFYAARSATVNLKNSYYTTKHKDEIAENEPLVITANIQYTEQNIIYRSRFWQLIKWAWIQYFSVMALFLFMSRKIKKFVFQNRVLQTIKIPPLQE